MKHILQRLVKSPGIHEGCAQHAKVPPGIVPEGEERGIDILDIDIRLLHLI